MSNEKQITEATQPDAAIDTARLLGDGRARLVKDFISSMEHAAEEAHDETVKWHGTNATLKQGGVSSVVLMTGRRFLSCA